MRSTSIGQSLALALATLGMVFLAGCGGGGSSSSDTPQAAKTAVDVIWS